MKARFTPYVLATALCGAGAFLVAAPAAAQDSSAASPAPAVPATAAEGAGLQDIVVTAQRRVQNLQDVPLSIVAITPDALKRTGVADIRALNNMIPNAVIEPVGLFPGVASLSIRGVGVSGIESFADPEVAVYINGIYQARNVNALSSTLDVSSIEVLRGPQGTLFGRNAFSGAISLRTNKPDLNALGGSLSVNYGNMDKLDVDGVLNVPLVNDKLAARVAVRYHKFGGYLKNSGLVPDASDPTGGPIYDSSLAGKRMSKEKSIYIRPTIRYQPNDQWDITLFGEYFRERSDAYSAGMIVLPTATGTNQVTATNPFGDSSLGLPSDGSDPRVSGGLRGSAYPVNNDQYNITLDAAYKIDDIGTIRLLSNYNHATSLGWADTDGSNYNIFSTERAETYSAYSSELQFTSSFSDKLDLVAGLYYLWDHYQTSQLTFSAVNNPSLWAVAPSLSNTAWNPGYINNEGKRKTWAAYAQAEYKITPKFSFVLGGRYSWERKYDYRGLNISFNSTGLTRTIDLEDHLWGTNTSAIFGPIAKNWKSFSPRIGVNYKLDRDILLFAFWQRAFKSGGFNANSASSIAFDTPFGQERDDNFEVGIKSDFLDHRLRVNLNAFYTKFKGLQRSLVTPTPAAPSGITTVTQNLANMESYGIEAEIAARVTSTWTLFLNAGWNKAKYTSYCADLDGASASPTAGRAVCGNATQITSTTYLYPQDYSNLRPLRAPRWDVTGGVTKVVPINDDTKATFNTSLNYRSSMYVQLLNVPYSYRPRQYTWDSSLEFSFDRGKYSLNFWGKNLTNQIEILNYLPVSGFADYNITPPRTYGVTGTVKF
ncbi:TonB-dependent receptor [Flavisphingomonas formosensis]|uniref:TonB-dependent receptor n=1 Tax=Flavisphingomonas formosensis TaxID=861534 RepID=UPI0012F990C0|nr:TonB-dependent receptor [Sphingomonas formosensis]